MSQTLNSMLTPAPSCSTSSLCVRWAISITIPLQGFEMSQSKRDYPSVHDPKPCCKDCCFMHSAVYCDQPERKVRINHNDYQDYCSPTSQSVLCLASRCGGCEAATNAVRQGKTCMLLAIIHMTHHMQEMLLGRHHQEMESMRYS